MIHTVKRKAVLIGFFVALFSVGIFLRTFRFYENYAVNDGDVARDYLVARHIVVWNEYPAVGPRNSVFEGINNSPFYYYFLSLFLFVHDSIYTLGWANIILQAVSMVALVVFAHALFGTATALFVSMLLFLNRELLNQSTFMWQPFAASAFFSLSYVFLALGHSLKRAAPVWAATLLYVWALGVGYYGFPSLPGFVFVLLVVLQRAGASKVQRIFLTCGMVFLTFILYLPVLQQVLATREIAGVIPSEAIVPSAIVYAQNLVRNVPILFDGFLRQQEGLSLWLRPAVLIFLIGLLMFRALSQAKKNQWTTAVIGLYVLQVPLFASLLTGRIFHHFFVAAHGLVVVLVAEALVSLMRNKTTVALGATAAFCVFLFAFPSIDLLRWVMFQNNSYEEHARATNAIVGALSDFPTTYGENWHQRFYVVVYQKTDGRTDKEAIFLATLEQRYATKLTKIVGSGNSFEQTGRGENVVLACMDYAAPDEAQAMCLGDYMKGSERVRSIKKIHEEGRYIIYFIQRLP